MHLTEKIVKIYQILDRLSQDPNNSRLNETLYFPLKEQINIILLIEKKF